jgi:hypothetical protein
MSRNLSPETATPPVEKKCCVGSNVINTAVAFEVLTAVTKRVLPSELQHHVVLRDPDVSEEINYVKFLVNLRIVLDLRF